MEKTLLYAWQVPFGEFSLKIDPLSLLFLAAVAILAVCAGVYGIGYLRRYAGAKPLKVHAVLYCLLALAIAVILTANNVILFLGAWEIMSITAYLLIVFNDEEASVRRAGFLYLIMSHCGTFFLFFMFFLLSQAAGSMNFDVIAGTNLPVPLRGTVFALALAGFGVKAGFPPLHIWLPHAHPAAPAHVSAFLSGVAIKTGIYGVCRVLWMTGALPGWCGYLMLALGVVSGVMGVLYALGQHELKKLLAYHSIENIGIICLGLGVGLIGRQYNMPVLAAAGFAGGLLHVLNHALFKGLLFLGAGSVIYRTHTGEMDRLGGLFKVMPVTGTVFLIGALAICGLPFFNGFISEFIIFASLFQGLLTLPVRGVLACAAAILALALMGALALACFTKVYGTVFLGEPRSAQDASGEKGTPLCMILPMVFLACLCAWIGIFPGRFVEFTFLGGEYLSRLSAKSVDTSFILGPLAAIVAGAAAFCCIAVSLIILRRICSGPVSAGERPQTWACGFSAVSSRMQYTSSSFAYPVIDFVKGLLLWRRRGTVVKGFFPAREHMHSSVSDVSDEYLFRPLLARLTHLSRKFYDGRVRHTQIYLLYIFLFLIFLLVWKMR